MARHPATHPARVRAGRFAGLAALVVGVLALGGTSAFAGAAPSSPAPVVAPAAAAPATTPAARAVRYAVGEHACAAPGSHSWSCFAVKYATVAKGTPGARPYLPHVGGHGPSGGFAPADLAKVYGYSAGAATHQTVAIVDAYDDPRALADLQAFDRHYGLAVDTAATFVKVNGSGAASPLPSADRGWSVEISLDVQTVRAVCNRCKIILVEASVADPSHLAAAVNTAVRLHATEVSNSYGGPEDPANPLPAADVSAYDHAGVVITGSTGDNGWYDWDYANYGEGGWGDNAPNTPSSLPTVVAVGGTSLTVDGNGNRTSETVWNGNGASDTNGLAASSAWLGPQGASGGGCSIKYSALSFQRSVDTYAGTGCGTKRLAGDVAADADPASGFDIYDSTPPAGYNNGWNTVGGTSLSSPLVAAMWALAGGAADSRYPAETLYDRYTYGTSPAGYLNDVTLGGNGFCGGDDTSTCSARLDADIPGDSNPNDVINGNGYYTGGWAGLLDCAFGSTHSDFTPSGGQCEAGPGYDGPSGVGTPNSLTLFRSMLPHTTMVVPALKLKVSEQFQATAFSDPVAGTSALAYHWNWGDGSTTTTSSAAVNHAYGKAGSYLVTLGTEDNLHRIGTVGRTVTVGMPLVPRFSAPTWIHMNAGRTYASATSSDPNTGSVLRHWLWRSGSVVLGHTPSLHFAFHSVGNHSLTLTIVDNQGMSASKTVMIKVV